MQKKTVYLVAYNYPPMGRGGSVTMLQFSKKLAKKFNLKIITSETPANPKELDPSLVREIPKNAEVIRVKKSHSPLGKIPLVDSLGLDWAIPASKQPGLQEKGTIIATYPTLSSLIAGYLLKKKHGHKLVLDFRDELLEVSKSRQPPLAKKAYGFLGIGTPLKPVQSRLLKAADHVTAATEGIKRALLQNHSISPKKITVVRNGFLEKKFKKKKAGKIFTVIYCGALTSIQSPHILIDAIEILFKKHPKARGKLRASFFGPENDYFERFIKPRVDGKIIAFGGFLSHEKALEEISGADAGFFSLLGKEYAYATPTKLFEYAMLEKPIIAAAFHGGDAWSLIEKNGIGLVADAADANAVADAIYKLYSGKRLRNKIIQTLREKRSQFGIKSQAEKLAKIINEL